ncbi:hypothetical protein CI109_103685 [Kwoniella shandongensis]|uniref:Uncharacterized protein n=1 Tax=Kwoniella shandongensis TaxID=1734106 RepID=A0A5M6CD60_9TREE|nr:uncharacterized protein CI109_000621 [Kwoniella shandongensis]KAA5531049.1 hypothetical protein CI109_000621 [Kwoniella shandongensis]
MSTLNLRPVASSSSSSTSKPIPSPSLLKPWDFSYSPSPDGKDVNLMIMFHGLGDTKAPFFNLAKQLNLPSTAILSLSAPDPIPLMDHPSFSWYSTFTPQFDPLPISSQNPTKPLPALRSLLSTLTSKEIGWKLESIHLFGWGQGGTVALELGLDIGKRPLTEQDREGGKRFGSIVSVCAGLLTHPTSDLKIATAVLWFNRLAPSSAAHQKTISILKRAYREVQSVQGQQQGSNANVEAMPRGKEEWWGIMKFWGQLLGRADEGWKGQGEVYEVVR